MMKTINPQNNTHVIPHLFSPLTIKNITFKNRIAVSPMCQYSAENGFANDWHFVHLGTRAAGGAALVFSEAAAVTPEGRISPQDLGIWSDEHIQPLARIVKFMETQNAIAGIQIAHAGRKASTKRPWERHGKPNIESDGWEPIAPSALPFSNDSVTPRELSTEEIPKIITAFAQAARRAFAAGFKVLEIHAAHGYLLHEFLSPLSNRRNDQYGGSFENRTRLLFEVITAIHAAWPKQLPLFVRISATDWVKEGWNVEDSINLSRELKKYGVDLIDASSGGSVLDAEIPYGPGYQVGFAQRIRHEVNIATGAVGLIAAPAQADEIIRTGQADIVLLARELLRNPYWPLHAAHILGHKIALPNQYLRAFL